MPKRMFGVIIPIAGHLYCEVEATTEEEAIEKAMDMEHTIEEIEEWWHIRAEGVRRAGACA
jgi:hypothetical protein